jgi:hypothetical protein
VKLGVRDAATPGGNLSDVVTLSVSDTGKGISKDFLRKRLFIPFNQEGHLSTGCGLGLSIAKSLTMSLNGTIEVRSQQGMGTTVSVNLPLSRGSRRSIGGEIPLVRQMDRSEPITSIAWNNSRLCRFHEANIGPRKSKIKASIKASVSSCMVDWLQMQRIGEQVDINDADYVVILVDERLSDFVQPYIDDVEKKQPRVIALLPSEMSRREVESALGKSIRVFKVVSAPSRAVAACEQTARN